MLGTTIRVQLGETVREYPQMIAELGNHLAENGAVVSLHDASRQAKAFFRKADEAWTALAFWTTLDSSGLAYRVDFNRHGSWKILGAAPMPGPDNVREVYTA